MNILFEQLGIHVPILLAPMAGVSGGALAGAVSQVGGLGLVGGGYCDRDWIHSELDIAAGTPVGVGFITWKLQQTPRILDEVLERQPKAVFLSFGEIRPFARRIRKVGVPLIAQVQTVADALGAKAEGADVIVAQGSEAGGHGGTRGSLALIPAVRDAIGDMPLIAAGGIVDGPGIVAALILGADAVLCGTAFYATRESLADPRGKELAVATTGDETARSNLFDAARGLHWPPSWTLRARRNAFHEHWAGQVEDIGQPEREAFQKACTAGDPDFLPVIIGEAIDRVSAVEPASEVMARLIAATEDCISSASNRLSKIWNGTHQ